MNNEYFKTGSFTNFKGEEQQFVVACVLTKEHEPIFNYNEDIIDIKLRMGIGVSICDKRDQFDLERGKMIASERAKTTRRDVAYFSCNSVISALTEEGVERALNNEVQFVKDHPGAFIAGYDDAKRKYLRKQHIKELYDSLPEDEKNFFDKCKNETVTEGFQELIALHAL